MSDVNYPEGFLNFPKIGPPCSSCSEIYCTSETLMEVRMRQDEECSHFTDFNDTTQEDVDLAVKRRKNAAR